MLSPTEQWTEGSMFFIAGVAGFSSGILIASLVNLSLFVTYFLIVPVLLLGFYGVLWRDKRVSATALFVCAAMLGMLRMHSALAPPPTLATYLGKEVTLQGTVVAEEDVRENTNKLTIAVTSVQGEVVPAVRVLATTNRFTHAQYGDRITVSGILSQPKNFQTDSGREFNYRGYLAKDRVYYLLSFAKIQETAPGKLSLRRTLFSLKQWFLHGVQRLLGEPDASLAGGITVGAKQSLGMKLLDAFRRVGLIHIVVLSGYNVTIIAEAILRFLTFLPRRTALVLSIIAISAFALLTGAGATIVRASIMAILALIARATGRTYTLTRALFLAGTIMLIVNPRILLFDPSFQLSFIATLGLIYIAPYIERRMLWIPERLGLREIVGATIGTQVAVFPLLMYMTGMISLLSLPANLLVLPIIPLSMLLVFITGIFGAVVPALGVPVAFAAHITLAYIVTVTQLFASIPFAAVALPAFPLWAMFGVYGAMIFWFWKKAAIQITQ